MQDVVRFLIELANGVLRGVILLCVLCAVGYWVGYWATRGFCAALNKYLHLSVGTMRVIVTNKEEL